MLSSKPRGGHGRFPSHSSLSPALPFPSPLGGKPARGGDAVPRYQNHQHPPTASDMAVAGVSPPGSAPPPAVPCAVTPLRTPTLTALPSLSQQGNAPKKRKANSSKWGAAHSPETFCVTQTRSGIHAPRVSASWSTLPERVCDCPCPAVSCASLEHPSPTG